jgi:hypothetical protein
LATPVEKDGIAIKERLLESCSGSSRPSYSHGVHAIAGKFSSGDIPASLLHRAYIVYTAGLNILTVRKADVTVYDSLL